MAIQSLMAAVSWDSEDGVITQAVYTFAFGGGDPRVHTATPRQNAILSAFLRATGAVPVVLGPNWYNPALEAISDVVLDPVPVFSDTDMGKAS